jgi:hypothetical protein
MWNKPHLLNTIADLLILAATAALLAAAVWLVRVPSLPVRQVVFAAGTGAYAAGGNRAVACRAR